MLLQQALFNSSGKSIAYPLVRYYSRSSARYIIQYLSVNHLPVGIESQFSSSKVFVALSEAKPFQENFFLSASPQGI
jgi:hypothetical protein